MQRFYTASIAFIGFVTLFSAYLIASSKSLVIDPTFQGVNSFAEIFKFPITASGALLALLAGKIALTSVEKSAQANILTLKHNMAVEFRNYLRSNCVLPLTELYNDENRRSLTEAMFKVSSVNYAITFSRMYEFSDRGVRENEELRKRIDGVKAEFDRFNSLTEKKDYHWVQSLIKLCIASRKLRFWLVITTKASEEWKGVQILENSEEFGKEILPYLSVASFRGIVYSIYYDLSCVMSVLYYEQVTRDSAKKLFQVKHAMTTLIDNLSPTDRTAFLNADVNKVWQEPYGLNIDLTLELR